jgi:hypothetical protein
MPPSDHKKVRQCGSWYKNKIKNKTVREFKKFDDFQLVFNTKKPPQRWGRLFFPTKTN